MASEWPNFSDSESLYGSLGAVIRDAVEAEGTRELAERFDSSIAFVTSSPEAEIAVFLRPTARTVVFGKGQATDTVCRAESGVMSALFTGALNVYIAEATGELMIEGNSSTLLVTLAPLIRKWVAPLYTAKLREQELQEFLPPEYPASETVSIVQFGRPFVYGEERSDQDG